MRDMDRRAELEGWIAQTRRNQGRLALALAVATVISIGLLVWNVRIGGLVLAVVVIVAVCGFWVTTSHIADWRGKLEQLDRPAGTLGRRI